MKEFLDCQIGSYYAKRSDSNHKTLIKECYEFQLGIETREYFFDSKEAAIVYAEARRQPYHKIVYIRLRDNTQYQSSIVIFGNLG